VRHISRPEHGARSTFELCANSIREDTFRLRLLSISDLIEVAESDYEAHATRTTLFEILPEDNIDNSVTRDEMDTIYKGHLSRLGSRSRYVYDAIRTSTRHGICPLCGHRQVATLDHYLAKSLHPIFAVTPLNLIPSCSDCNKAKLNRQPARASDQTLHPYFDNVANEVWLRATLIEGAPPAVMFRVSPPNCWSKLEFDRVSLHFRTFRLAELYSANAAQELAQIGYGLGKVADSSGANSVKLHLLDQAESRSAEEPNSWQAALYKTLAESEWFCNGGHRNASN
jgi:hypothetical protein